MVGAPRNRGERGTLGFLEPEVGGVATRLRAQIMKQPICPTRPLRFLATASVFLLGLSASAFALADPCPSELPECAASLSDFDALLDTSHGQLEGVGSTTALALWSALAPPTPASSAQGKQNQKKQQQKKQQQKQQQQKKKKKKQQQQLKKKQAPTQRPL